MQGWFETKKSCVILEEQTLEMLIPAAIITGYLVFGFEESNTVPIMATLARDRHLIDPDRYLHSSVSAFQRQRNIKSSMGM